MSARHDDARMILQRRNLSDDLVERSCLAFDWDVSNRPTRQLWGSVRKLDVPDPLLQFIECRPARGTRSARGVDRGPRPRAKLAIKQSCTQGMLEVGNDLRYAGWETRQLRAALLRLPDCTTAKKHPQNSRQAAKSTSDMVVPIGLSWPQAPRFHR